MLRESRWGETIEHGEEWVDEVLSEGDEELVDLLQDLEDGNEHDTKEKEVPVVEAKEKKKQGKMTDWISSSRSEVISNVKVTTQMKEKRMIQKSLSGWINQELNYPNIFPFSCVAVPEPAEEDEKNGRKVELGKTSVLEVRQQTLVRDSPPGLRSEVSGKVETKEEI